MRSWVVAMHVFVVLLMMGCENSHEKRIQRLEAMFVEYALHNDNGDSQLAIATSDRMLEIMGNDIVDYRPYTIGGEAYVWAGRPEKAQEYFMKALNAIKNPSLVESPFITSQTLRIDAKLIERRIMLLKSGKSWKNNKEFRSLIRSDTEQNNPKGDR